MVAFAGYPLVVAERLVGVVAMFARRPLSDVTLQAIGSVADEIAIGIDRREGEESLRQGEAHLRLVTDSLPVLIASVDAQERYRFNNRTYEEWVGRSRAEVTGKTLREVVGETFYEAIAANVAAVLSGETVTYERETVWPDGKYRFARGTYVPQFGPSGAVEGFTILVTDVTEARQAVTGLAATNQRLQLALAREALVNQISRAARGSLTPTPSCAPRSRPWVRRSGRTAATTSPTTCPVTTAPSAPTGTSTGWTPSRASTASPSTPPTATRRTWRATRTWSRTPSPCPTTPSR